MSMPDAAKARKKLEIQGVYHRGKAVKNRTDFDSEAQFKKCDRKGLKVVRVGYVTVPDAGSRLSHALDILLSSAARKLEGDTNAKKAESSKDSQPKKIAD